VRYSLRSTPHWLRFYLLFGVVHNLSAPRSPPPPPAPAQAIFRI
jgi:hypothetical protein